MLIFYSYILFKLYFLNITYKILYLSILLYNKYLLYSIYKMSPIDHKSNSSIYQNNIYAPTHCLSTPHSVELIGR